MQKTRALIETRMPPDIAAIVIAYFAAEKRKTHHVARAGEWETCMGIRYSVAYGGLSGALEGGHLELAEMIKSRAELELGSWNFYYACKGGHRDVVDHLILQGARFWEYGLSGACKGGHLDLAKDMLSRGARDVNDAFLTACKGGHPELVRLMIAHGADNFGIAIYFSFASGHAYIAELIASIVLADHTPSGAQKLQDSYDSALRIADYNGGKLGLYAQIWTYRAHLFGVR